MTEATGPVAPPTLIQKLSAEAIGTFVLVLFGVGAVAGSQLGSGDYASVGLAFGIAVVVMVYAFGRVSGGHFNPAVSVGAALGGRISWKEAGTYIGAQLAGGIVAGLVLALILVAGETGYEIGEPLGANGFGDHGGVALGGALIIEIVMTFVFLTVILAVTDTRNEHPGLAPLAIGLALAAVHFGSMWATGTSVNPARSIGVGLFSGGDAIAQLWLFIVAPLVGGALAGLAYPALFGHGTDPVPGSGLHFSGPKQAVPGYGTPDQYQQQWNQQVPGYPQTQQAQPNDQLQQQWNQPQQQPAGPAAGSTTGQPVQAQPAQAQPAQAQPVEAQPVQQPIIQDGWQWDPQAQQWIPAQQQPPAQP